MRLLLLFFSFSAWCSSPEFDQGVEALSQKNYTKAITSFQEALKQEPENLTAWHNLALSHLSQKEDIQAYAYWRKALVLDPGFRPAKDALQYLMKAGKISQIPNPTIFARIGLSQLLSVLFLVTFATAILLIRFLKTRQQGQNPPLSILTMAIILWITLGCVTALKTFSQFTVKSIVLANSVAAQSAPVENGSQLFNLKGGEEADILKREGDWLQISYGSLVGWVPKQSLLALDRSIPW